MESRQYSTSSREYTEDVRRNREFGQSLVEARHLLHSVPSGAEGLFFHHNQVHVRVVPRVAAAAHSLKQRFNKGDHRLAIDGFGFRTAPSYRNLTA